MTTIYTFGDQLGTSIIRVKSNGEATFHRKKYKSYRGARAALNRWAEPVWLIKKETK